MFHLPMKGKAVVEKDTAEDKVSSGTDMRKKKKTTGQLEANRKHQA